MKRRRVYPFLLSACLLIGPGGFVENRDDYAYILEDGKATITAYLGSDAKVLIPSMLGNMPVEAIGDGAFAGSDLRMAEIPGTVTAIGEGAFSQCENLFSVDMPHTVQFIGEGAFHGCSLITVWTTDIGYVADYMSANHISYRFING